MKPYFINDIKITPEFLFNLVILHCSIKKRVGQSCKIEFDNTTINCNDYGNYVTFNLVINTKSYATLSELLHDVSKSITVTKHVNLKSRRASHELLRAFN